MDFLTEPEVAQLLRIAPATLRQWRHRRVGPPYLKLGAARKARVIYARESLERWLAGWARLGGGNDRR